MRAHQVVREQFSFDFDEPAAPNLDANGAKISPVTLVCADVLAWAERYEGPKFHALMADPPYHLISDTRNGSPRNPGTGPYGRHTVSTNGKGFMGQDWDGGDIAFRPDTWKALAQHLLPGAFGMVFASARGVHRLAVAIEDAGLILHPAIFLYAFGSGFPKSTRVPDERFTGHRYGLQAIKPAVEPLLLWQKPYLNGARSSITQTGAGALNIDGGRVSITSDDPNIRDHASSRSAPHYSGHVYNGGAPGGYDRRSPTLQHPAGRWPANFALCHTEQCVRVGVRQVKSESGGVMGTHQRAQQGYIYGGNTAHEFVTLSAYKDATGQETVAAWACAAQCPVLLLDQQAGERKSGGRTHLVGEECHSQWRAHEGRSDPRLRASDYTREPSMGSASRFFMVADWSLDVAERLAQANPVFYCAKASRAERDAGLEGMPLIVGFNKNTSEWKADARHPDGGYENHLSQVRNVHPTVKPLTLTQWLATLLLPPAAYAPRRLLNPFGGVASEALGAMRAGWDEIVMIEQDQQYVEIAQKRVTYWQHRR